MSTNTKLAEALRACMADIELWMETYKRQAGSLEVLDRARKVLAAHDAEQAAQAVPAGGMILPDRSAFALACWPLPKDHWLYAPRGDWDSERDEFAECPRPILTNAQREAVMTAARYAIRGATMCGQEPDLDPDALALNFAYALCGPAGGAAAAAQALQAQVALPMLLDDHGNEGSSGQLLALDADGKRTWTAAPQAQAAGQDSESATAEEWERELSAVMPADFKDWWQSNRREWPKVAADVIRNQREDRDLGWEMAALAQRQPLTDEQIKIGRWATSANPDDWPESWAFSEGVRFAEKHHGIGGATTGEQHG